jgi:hypothetical protein
MSRLQIEKAAYDIDVFSRRTNNNKYFSFFVIRNIHHLTPEIQSINTIRQSMMAGDRIQEYDKKRVELAESLCTVDENGKPKLVREVDTFNNAQHVYDFTEENRKAFTEKFKELSIEYADDLTEFEASVNEFSFLMNEEIEIDVTKISFKYIPDDVSITNILKFVDESNEEIEKLL